MLKLVESLAAKAERANRTTVEYLPCLWLVQNLIEVADDIVKQVLVPTLVRDGTQRVSRERSEIDCFQLSLYQPPDKGIETGRLCLAPISRALTILLHSISTSRY
jgi:hypothetical protein